MLLYLAVHVLYLYKNGHNTMDNPYPGPGGGTVWRSQAFSQQGNINKFVEYCFDDRFPMNVVKPLMKEKKNIVW